MLTYQALWSASYCTVGLVANVTKHCSVHRHSVMQALQVFEGSEPNEHGTWQYGRGGWCDGQEVKQHLELLHCVIVVILHICNTNMYLQLPSCCYTFA